MLLRAPGSTRTDRLFPYTTRVRRGVGDQQGEALAFGLEQLGVRLAAACGQAPVDVARVVSVRVLARLRILHPAPAQRRRRLAADAMAPASRRDRKSTRLNSSH